MMLVLLAVPVGVGVVNQGWKMSAHPAVSAGTVTVLVFLPFA
jgi:hypothetical protein